MAVGLHPRGNVIEKDRSSVATRTMAQFVPADQLQFVTTASNWTFSRVGLGRYAMVHTNVDETSLIVGTFTAAQINTVAADASRGEVARGAQLTACKIFYFNASTSGSDLDAAVTATVQTLALSDGVAVAAATDRPVTHTGGSVTKSDTLIRVVTATITTPFVVTNAMAVTVEWTFNSSATSDSEVYGILWGFNVLL